MKRCVIVIVSALFWSHAGFGQTISSASPSDAEVGQELAITITCANDSFLTCAMVASWSSCNSTVGKVFLKNNDSIRVASSIANLQKTSLTATVGFPLSCPTGKWDIAVVHNNGRADTIWKIQGFNVNPLSEPVLDSISPKTAYRNRNVAINVFGTHTHFRVFQQTSSVNNVTNVWLKRNAANVKADSVKPSTSRMLTAYFSIPGSADTGMYSVQVDQGSGLASPSLQNAFLIKSLPSSVYTLPDGCIAYYPLDNDAVDFSSNGNDGTMSGTTPVQGMYGSALSFNGSSSYVSVPDNGSFTITNGLSICAWIKPELGNMWYRVVGKTNSAGSNNDWVLGEALAGGIYFSIWKGGTQYSTNGSNPLTLNGWNHIAGTWDGKCMRIYQNGIAQPETVSVTPPISSSGNPLYIGKMPNNTYYFKGAIDEIMIFNRGLSGAEIDSIYRGTYLGKPLNDSTIPVLVPFQPKVTLSCRPVFIWHRVTGATSYILAVASDISFVNTLSMVSVSDTSHAMTAAVPVGTLFWRVKSDLNIRWSPIDKFIVQSDTVPFLVRFSGASVRSMRPKFVWGRVAAATVYRIEIAQTASFSNPLSMPTEDTTFSPLADMLTGTYYWHVSCDRNYTNFCPPDSLVVDVATRALTGGPAAGNSEFGRLVASLGAFAPGCDLWIYALNGKRSVIVSSVNLQSGFKKSLKASGVTLSAGVYLAVVKKNGAVVATKRFLQH